MTAAASSVPGGARISPIELERLSGQEQARLPGRVVQGRQRLWQLWPLAVGSGEGGWGSSGYGDRSRRKRPSRTYTTEKVAKLAKSLAHK